MSHIKFCFNFRPARSESQTTLKSITEQIFRGLKEIKLRTSKGIGFTNFSTIGCGANAFGIFRNKIKGMSNTYKPKFYFPEPWKGTIYNLHQTSTIFYHTFSFKNFDILHSRTGGCNRHLYFTIKEFLSPASIHFGAHAGAV